MKLSFILATILTFVTCGISQRQHVYNYNYNYNNFRQPSRRPISSFQQQRPRPHHPISSPVSQTCIYNGQFLPNSKDPRQYSVCMRSQNTNIWFKYSYNCPSFTRYDALRSQCIQGLPETTTTTTESAASVLSITHPPTSSTAEDSKKSESSTPSTQTEVVTEQETSTLQIPTTMVPEFSSSEEIFMTHPPHFTRPDASSISQVSPPVHVAWNPTLPSSRPRPTGEKPMTIVYNPNSDHFKTSTRAPPISSADYERLTFLNALQQNKLTNGFPHLSAAQRIPLDNNNVVSASSPKIPVTDSWSYGDKEAETSTRFPARWRPKSPLNKSSSFES